MAVVAVCLGVAAYAAARDVRALDTRGVTVQGTIVEFTGLRARCVVVEFDTADGRQVRAGTSNYLDVGDEGDPLTVVYDPEDPWLIRSADWGVDYTDAVLLALLTVGCVGLAARTWRRGIPSRLRRWFRRG